MAARISDRFGLLDDIKLEMETVEDTFEKAIARYDFPFADGADLEDMGQKAHTLRVRCWFFDNDAQATYDDHIELLNRLQQKVDFALVHPQYGSITGKVESVAVRHDDQQRTAVVDFTFVERMRAPITPQPAFDVESAAEGAFLAGEDEQYDELAEDFAAEGFDVELELDPEQSLFDQFKGFAAQAREIAKEVDGYIAELSAYADEITQPINSLTATVKYATSLPGRVLGIVTRSVERVARLSDSLFNFPARFLANADFGFRKLILALESLSPSRSYAGSRARAIVIRHVRIAFARRLALEAAYAYAADEKERRVVRRLEKGRTFDAAGRYLAPPLPAPIMNVRELEESLALVRGTLQEAVDQARGMQSLKDQALQLLVHVEEVKIERERIVRIEVDNPLPLHLVCLANGLPYNYAERIRSINPGMARPNFVSGGVSIYGR